MKLIVITAIHLGLCTVGGPSSYNGHSGNTSSSYCDYIVSSQLKKPLIHLYQWSKSQVSISICIYLVYY